VIGKTVSHYKILSQLGAGGMGIVYAGEDVRLGRPVALKFVPEELAKDRLATERLLGEARTASGLNHANICTIYDIGEHEGQSFIVMELLKGQTLRERLAGGPLKIHEAVELGIQVADALDSAHRHDIIHRDIKPPNLFLVERGPVKILDFGLAKLISRTTAATTTVGSTRDRTAEGMTVGTVSYMSPEQVTGELLDGRTDLFSLGVVLYEALTGHQPFTGKTSAVVFAAILTRAPVAPVVFKPELPLRLQEVVNNCLEKDRELRYQDAAGLRADLKRVKRDLESGHSGVFRLTGSVPGGQPTSAWVQTTPPYAHSAPPEPAKQAAAGTSSRKPFVTLTVTVVVAAAMVLATASSLWIWSRGRVSPGIAGDTSSQAFIGTRLELATARLESKDYRGAIAYADQVLGAAPDNREATRILDAARLNLKRFDDAIARTTDLLAAGNTAGAMSALSDARAIDPAATVVGELSARLARQLSMADTTRRDAQPARSPSVKAQAPAPPPQVANQPARPDVLRPRPSDEPATLAAPLPPPAASSTPQEPVAAPPAVVAPPPAGPVPPPEPAPSVSQTAPARPETPTERHDAAAGPARGPETDDAAIRRVVMTYARASESKDLALYRTVKPNLSPDEQRRIEDGFRAVTSQKVDVAVLSIEQRGQDATVRLRRRDTIQAGGRQQTTESLQTMILTRTASGWTIREIGR
jgi:protein kinase-like protein